MFHAGERSWVVFISSLWSPDVTIPTNTPGDSLHINHWKGKTRFILKQTWSTKQVYTDFTDVPELYSLYSYRTLHTFLDLPGELMQLLDSKAVQNTWAGLQAGKNYGLQLKHNPTKIM